MFILFLVEPNSGFDWGFCIRTVSKTPSKIVGHTPDSAVRSCFMQSELHSCLCHRSFLHDVYNSIFSISDFDLFCDFKE